MNDTCAHCDQPMDEPIRTSLCKGEPEWVCHRCYVNIILPFDCFQCAMDVREAM